MNGEANRAKQRQNRAIITRDVRRFGHAINTYQVFGTHTGLPGYEFASWFGVLAPPGTPPAVVKKLNTEIVKVLRSSDISARLSDEGAELIASSPEAFDAYLKSETVKWGKVITAAGIHQSQ